MNPKITTIITTYNHGIFLSDAIDSVLAQTYHGQIEIIVVDDESTDDTPAIASKYGESISYHRISHAGKSKAANYGLKKASGDFIAFLDADDVWEPEKLDKQIKVFNENPHVGVVYARRSWIDPQGRLQQIDPRPLHKGYILEEIFFDNIICYSSVLIRREVWNAYGGFNENLCASMDYELWLRLAALTYFDYCDEALVRYRTGHTNLSKNKEQRFTIALQIMDAFIRCNPSLLPRSLVKQAFADTFVNWAYYVRDVNYQRALSMYLHAIRWRPSHMPAYKALLTLHLRQFKRRSRSLQY
jgi:glycosyltransferase involved in cell wall biosynthesis